MLLELYFLQNENDQNQLKVWCAQEEKFCLSQQYLPFSLGLGCLYSIVFLKLSTMLVICLLLINFFIIESIKDIDLRKIKKRNKFVIIYRYIEKQDKIFEIRVLGSNANLGILNFLLLTIWNWQKNWALMEYIYLQKIENLSICI